jgi:hypothetical protein
VSSFFFYMFTQFAHKSANARLLASPDFIDI